MAKTPKIGEIRNVPGWGILRVAQYDSECNAFAMQGHGPNKSTNWFWFYARNIGPIASADAILAEWKKYDQRNLSCNNPLCWCRAYTPPLPAPKS